MSRTHAVVVPTALTDLDRLSRVVAALLGQTLRPREVIVVAPRPVRVDGVRAVRSPRWGTATQRNVGLAAAAADVVHFVDDDVVTDPGYLQAIDAAFEDPAVVGATGNLARPAARRIAPSWLRRTPPGRVDAAGVATPIDLAGGDHDVDWLPGGVMAVRADTVSGLSFDEVLERGPTGPYALAEDVDFSVRLRSRGRLRFVAAAAAVHVGSTDSRLGDPRFWEMRLLTRRYFATKADFGLSAAAVRRRLVVDVALAATLVVTRRGHRDCLTGALRGLTGPGLQRRRPPTDVIDSRAVGWPR